MGCGISTMDRNDIASTGRRRVYGRLRHQNAIVPPVGDNNKKICDNVDDDYNDYQEPKRNEEGLIEKKCVVDKKDEERNIVIINERQKKLEEDKVSINHKNVMNYEEEEENNEDRIIGPGSPSFREYCNDSDLVDTSFCSDSVDRRISAVDSNDCDSGESTKNSSEYFDSYHVLF